jgi:GR25 family glycosyltransferase involved in LPS biosynthesis
MYNILQKENCDKEVIFIESYDGEEVTYEDYLKHFKADTLEWQNRGYKKFWPHYPLKKQEVSLALKHVTAMRIFLESDKDIALFLEDDAILDEGFFTKLDKHLDTLNTYFDVAFIGRGCKPSISNVEGWHFNLEDRNTDSMIMSRKFVTKFLDYVDTIRMCFPIDHELNYFIGYCRCNVYWLEPPIVTQGSHLGIFDSFQDAHSKFNDKTLPVRSDLNELMEQI